MSETPWAHVQARFAAGEPFESALEGLREHQLTGEDVGVLLNSASPEFQKWVHAGAGDEPVMLAAQEPTSQTLLPERRSAKRGLFGWLSGENAIEGLGLFTQSDVFELEAVQFAVLGQPILPVAYGEIVLCACWRSTALRRRCGSR